MFRLERIVEPGGWGNRSFGNVSPALELSGIKFDNELGIVRYIYSVNGNHAGQALQSKLLIVGSLLPVLIQSRIH